MVQVKAILPGEPSYDWQGNIRPLSANHAEGVGVYDAGQLVGSLTWRANPDSLHLVAGFIQPEYRSQGLMQRLFSYATALHPDTPITGDSEEGNPLRTMYDTYNYHLLRGTAGLTNASTDDILWREKGEDYGKDLEQEEGGKGRQAACWRESQAQGYVTAGNEGEEYAWPSFDDIHEISLGAVENHQGYRDPGLVEGAVGNTQMQQMYGQHEDIFDTTAHLIAKIQRQQAIVEGNKRTATNVGIAFLANNGYDTSGLTDSEEKEDRLIWLIYNISDAVNAGGDAIIEQLAQFLRENCKPEHQAKVAGLWEDAFKQGHGAAFWYDGSQLHWGDTHYMIFHNLSHSLTDDWTERAGGIYGWVFPSEEEDEYYPGEPAYGIEFGTDFGINANKTNPHLERDAAHEVEYAIGYPADRVYYSKTAGHDYEPDDLLHDTSSSCFGCGAPVSDDICGNCGHENMMWWTGGGEGLQNFKGSITKQSVTYDGQNYSCFAFLPPMLYLGNRHHMAIMNQLLQHGFTWEQLMAAKQLWGWSSDQGDIEGDEIALYLQTDAAMLDKSLLPQLEAAFTKLTGKSKFVLKSDMEPTNEEYAPDWDSHYGDEGFYTTVPAVFVFNSETGQEELWDEADTHTGSWQEDLQFSRLATLDKLLRVGYNSKTADWEEQFALPIDEDLGNFEQEKNSLSEDQLKQEGIEGPFDIDGWTVYTRDCDGVYPNHDALWIDRGKKIAVIGWQGHHSDLMEGSNFMGSLMMNASPYDQTAGHFRTEPSTEEPFPAGWGWHGSPGTKEEKNVIKQVLKKHYNVENLKDLYTSNPDAEHDYMEDDEEHEAKVAKAVVALQNLTKQQMYDILKDKQLSQAV